MIVYRLSLTSGGGLVGVSGGSGNWKEGGLVHIPWVKSELSGER